MSAILLDEDYLPFIMSGRKESDGLRWIGEIRLMPLKASAWLDLKVRQAKREAVDPKNVRNHADEVMRLTLVLVCSLTVTPIEASSGGKRLGV